MEVFGRGKNGSVNMIVFSFSNSESAYANIHPLELRPAESLRARDRGPPILMVF